VPLIRAELSTEEQNGVTAITVRIGVIGETPIVDMVRKAAVNKTFLEPGDTRQQWKGEAAACFVFVQGSPVAARYRPPVPATGRPLLSCILVLTSASEAKFSFGGDFLFLFHFRAILLALPSNLTA
jgi:hypothetical protein